ncbi:hypothetical protein AMTRI_Chr11g152630 [Amborella trichopoda]
MSYASQMVVKYVEGFWLLLAETCYLYCSHYMHRNHLLEDMKVFQRERLNVAFVVSNTLFAMPFLINLSIWTLMLEVFLLFLKIRWMIGSWYSSECSNPYIAI